MLIGSGTREIKRIRADNKPSAFHALICCRTTPLQCPREASRRARRLARRRRARRTRRVSRRIFWGLTDAAGIPASIPEDDISPELCTIESAKPGAEIWHVHAVAIDSEKDLDKDW